MESDHFPLDFTPPTVSVLPSRCLPLLPCGLGTPFQESLPSYLNRLAMAHGLSVAALFSSEIVPTLEQDRRPWTIATYLHHNSACLLFGQRGALQVAAHVAHLTGVPQVSSLVHPFLASFLGGARRSAVWCPQCFAEWSRENLPLYFPLLWAFQVVRCCSRHNVVLRDACPSCCKAPPYLAESAWSGRCSGCNSSFAAAPDLPLPTQLEKDCARLVEGFFRWAVSISGPSDFLSPLLANVRLAAAVSGNLQCLSRELGSPDYAVSKWLDRRTVSFNTLLRLSILFGVPLEAWFAPMDLGCFWKPSKVPDVPWLCAPWRPITPAHIEQVLRDAIASPALVPLSPTAVARSLRIPLARLRRDFPDLIARILARHHEYRVSRGPAVRKLVADALAERTSLGLPVNPRDLLQHLGPRWPLPPRRLTNVLWELRHQAYEPTPADHVPDVLRQALSPASTPLPLAAVAQSVGIPEARLRRDYPDLAARIVARNREQRGPRLRRLVLDGIAECTHLGLPVGPKPVWAHLGPRWPRSWQTFKQIFKECQAEAEKSR